MLTRIALSVIAVCLVVLVLIQLDSIHPQVIQSATALESQDQPTAVLRAQRFELVDKDGKVRGEFSIDDQNQSRFRMHDKEGNPIVRIVVSKNGAAGFGIYTKKGFPLAALGIDPDGDAQLQLMKGDFLAAGQEKMDPPPSAVVILSVEGGCSLGLLNFQEKTECRISTLSGVPRLELKANGKQLWKAP